MVLNGSDMMALYHQPRKVLIQWWLMLNSWKWPDGLPNPEPLIYENIRFTRRGRIMKWISSKVGMKAILREHNKKMSYFEFKDFWEAHYEANKEARERYRKFSYQRCLLRYVPKPSINHRFLYEMSPSYSRYRDYLKGSQ